MVMTHTYGLYSHGLPNAPQPRRRLHRQRLDRGPLQAHVGLYIGCISASPTACLLRGYGRAGTQNYRLAEAVILSTGASIPAQ